MRTKPPLAMVTVRAEGATDSRASQQVWAESFTGRFAVTDRSRPFFRVQGPESGAFHGQRRKNLTQFQIYRMLKISMEVLRPSSCK